MAFRRASPLLFSLVLLLFLHAKVGVDGKAVHVRLRSEFASGSLLHQTAYANAALGCDTV
jgi:hypothetical protein